MFARWVFASVKGVVCWFTGVSLFCAVASSSRAESKKELRVGYQKSGALLLTKTSGLLEKALAPLGYTVVWREFPSGLPLLEALNGGSIDIGHSGDAPLLFAQAAGIPFRIFAAGIGGRREFYFGRAEFLQTNPKVVDVIMAVLCDTGQAAKRDPKATADFLAEKLCISPSVMERSELRKQRYFAQPISTEIVNEQQAGADIFFRLGLMPKAIRVADIVYASHSSTP